LWLHATVLLLLLVCCCLVQLGCISSCYTHSWQGSVCMIMSYMLLNARQGRTACVCIQSCASSGNPRDCSQQNQVVGCKPKRAALSTGRVQHALPRSVYSRGVEWKAIIIITVITVLSCGRGRTHEPKQSPRRGDASNSAASECELGITRGRQRQGDRKMRSAGQTLNPNSRQKQRPVSHQAASLALRRLLLAE